MDPSQLVPVVLSVVIAAAGIAGYFKANVSKSTIALYRENNEALLERVSLLELKVKEDAIRIQALETARNTLINVITQAEAIARLTATVDRIAEKVGV